MSETISMTTKLIESTFLGKLHLEPWTILFLEFSFGMVLGYFSASYPLENGVP